MGILAGGRRSTLAAAGAAAIVACLVLGACGNTARAREDAAGSPVPSGTRTTTASPAPSGPTPGQTATSAAGQGSATPAATQTLPPAADRPDVITGGPNESSVYSPACPLQRATPCNLDFTGFYRLMTQPRAVVVVQAFENDSTTPAASGAFWLPNGSNPWKAKLPYQVGPNARKVTFVVSMKTEDGRVLSVAPKATYEVYS